MYNSHMVEQSGYPYVEGRYGVQFHAMQEGEAINILGGSGRILKYNLFPEEIRVYDPDIDSPTELFANVSDGMIRFSLFPRLTTSEESPYHPDLFASKFMDVAINYFRDVGIQITGCIADWYLGTNQQQYWRMREEGYDREHSANSTWMGKKLIEKGFKPVSDEDIFEKNKFVIANFWKQ